MTPLKDTLGAPIEDAGEETFLLFSEDIPSNNLGFVDSKADTLEVEVAGQDYTIRQSPSLLNSYRDEGTTGAVLWKITPRLGSWLASKPTILADILHNDSLVVELGCGIAGLIGLVLSKVVKCYILTDQAYVMKHLRENISTNVSLAQSSRKGTRKSDNEKADDSSRGLRLLSLDWEKDTVQNLEMAMPPGSIVDLVILCDCVYNEYLIKPLVQTCTDLCRMKATNNYPTTVLIAQQLRSEAVFELFLEMMMKEFNVWRVPEDKISNELGAGSGYAVHLAQLKDNSRIESQ